jgi:hypothetical protein
MGGAGRSGRRRRWSDTVGQLLLLVENAVDAVATVKRSDTVGQGEPAGSGTLIFSRCSPSAAVAVARTVCNS